MSLLVSGVATLNAVGAVVAGFTAKWIVAWLGSWAAAYPAVLVIPPLVRSLAARCLQPRG